MRRIVGVDVGGTKIASVLLEPGSEYKILSQQRLDTEASGGKDHILDRIYRSIDSVLEQQNLQQDLLQNDLSGIGIALPGPVDCKTGMSFECPNLKGWVNVDIKTILEDRYGVPVYADNDAHAATVGEAVFGIGRQFKNFLYVCVSTGIGCGIIINGELYKGADGAAGELSHVIFADGTELYKQASGTALRELFSISAEDLKRLCKAGDAKALDAFEHLLHYLSVGIANAVTMLNPEAVVIGGGMSNLGDFLLAPLEKRVKDYAFSVSGVNVRILKAQKNIDAGVLGIARLADKNC